MRRGEGWNQSREHLLAGVWHLATHSTEVLEAVPDGMDVGHSHEHDLTVGVVLCRHERGEWSIMGYPGNSMQDKGSPVSKTPTAGPTLQDGN